MSESEKDPSVPVSDVTVADVTPPTTEASTFKPSEHLPTKSEAGVPSTTDKIKALTQQMMQKVAAQSGGRLVSFDDTESTEKEFPVFKAEAGRSYRIGFPVPFFIEVVFHFHESSKRKFQCIEGICCDRAGPPQRRFGTTAVLYETNSKGELTEPFSYKVVAFLCNDERANYIQKMHAEVGLDNYDLGFTCTDAQYQKMDPFPKKQAIWTLDPDTCAQILELCNKYAGWIPARIAKKMTEREILDLVRGGGAPGGSLVTPEVGAAPTTDFSSLFRKK